MTLRFERASATTNAVPEGSDDLLGRHLWTAPPQPSAGRPPLLAPHVPQLALADLWRGTAPVQHSRSGHFELCSDGAWLHGQACVTLPVEGPALQAAVHQLYAELFEALRQYPSLHLLRLWNYLPHINAELDGLEVYRHFNIGRQQAFLDAGASAFEGAPAACALGHHGGPLWLAFLAGPVAPQPVENPRQLSAYHYPTDYGPRSPTFSRAVRVEPPGQDALLFISGTASIVGHHTMHPHDVAAQTAETLRNLLAVIEAAHARSGARFALDQLSHAIYLRHPEHLPAVRALFEQCVGADSVAARSAIYLHADICRADLLVEIEAHGRCVHQDS